MQARLVYIYIFQRGQSSQKCRLLEGAIPTQSGLHRFCAGWYELLRAPFFARGCIISLQRGSTYFKGAVHTLAPYFEDIWSPRTRCQTLTDIGSAKDSQA